MNFPYTSSVSTATMCFGMSMNGTSWTIVSIKLYVSTSLKVVVSVEMFKEEFCVSVNFLACRNLLALNYPVVTAVPFAVRAESRNLLLSS